MRDRLDAAVRRRRPDDAAVHDIVGRLFEPPRAGQPPLIRDLLDKSAFTAREAAPASRSARLSASRSALVLHHSRLLRRGFLPYVVASQTIPILAIAPMVVIWGGSVGLPVWVRVGDDLRLPHLLPGHDQHDPRPRLGRPARARADALLRGVAAGRVLWKVKFPASLPFIFAALKIAATASVVGAIIGELPSSIQDGLGGAILNFNQYYSLDPPALWATNIVAAALGIVFFAVVVLVERLVVQPRAGARRVTRRRRRPIESVTKTFASGGNDGARRTSTSSSSRASSSR